MSKFEINEFSAAVLFANKFSFTKFFLAIDSSRDWNNLSAFAIFLADNVKISYRVRLYHLAIAKFISLLYFKFVVCSTIHSKTGSSQVLFLLIEIVLHHLNSIDIHLMYTYRNIPLYIFVPFLHHTYEITCQKITIWKRRKEK